MDKTIGCAAQTAPTRIPRPLVHVRTLGRFSVLVDGEPLRFGRKLPRKPLELLKATVAMGPSAVCRARLADALWPDAEADAAFNALDMALLRLRRLLGGAETVLQRGGRIALNATCCAIDAAQLEHLARVRAEAPGADGAAATLRVAFSLYRGEFLPDEEAAWAIPTRERLRECFVRLVAEHANGLERRGAWEEVLHLFHQAMGVDEGCEAFGQGVVRASVRLGREVEAAAARQRLGRLREAQARLAGTGFQSVGYR